jgi:hypothetical protein
MSVMLLTKKEKEILNRAFEMYTKELCEKLPSKHELSHVTFSDEFILKMQRLIRAREKFYYSWFSTTAKKVASIILAVVIGFTATVMSVEGLREKFINFIVETFKLGSIVKVVNVEDDFEFVKMSPRYIPDGFILEKEVYVEGNIFRTKYTSNNDLWINYTQNTSTEALTGINTENVDYTKLSIDGFEGILTIKDGIYNIVFNDGFYTFNVSTNLSEQEVIKIAESIF